LRSHSDTKDQIIDAVELVLSEKGIQEATIAEIAQRAGVTDSVIYHHFKNKEDLMFSLVGVYQDEMLDKLVEQLGGILEPISRLSKMVWFMLHYNETNQIYSKLLLFECRSNTAFFNHATYQSVRKCAGNLLSILENGSEVGVFRDDVNMRVVRELVLGAIDMENINYFLGNGYKLNSTTQDVPALVDLLRAMIEYAPARSEQNTNKSERIVLAAEKVFSEKGYNQATISEIARFAGIADGTIYEYFGNKSELLMSVPRLRFSEHMDSLQEVFEIKTPIRKLRRFIRYHFLLYMAEPEFLRTFMLNVQFNPEFYSSEAYSIYQEYTDIVDAILAEGKEAGTIRESVNSRVFKNLLFGGFSHLALRWLLSDDKNAIDKNREIDEIVNLLTRAVEQV